MLKTHGKNIISPSGKKIRLTGISLGGWLMMEGYMLGGRNLAEHIFKEKLGNRAEAFSREFRQRFLTEKDADTIKKLGFNCVRLPFNYHLIEEQGGMELLSRAVGWFAERNIYVIIDMHAVPGAQNKDWHSDSDGNANFWEKEEHREHYFKLWDRLSKVFKDNEMVAGYDVMNEPVTEKIDLLKSVYAKVIDVIRKNGDNHIIFLEGNNWAQEVEFLPDLLKENIAISVHFYEPFQFTFNHYPVLTYPGKIEGTQWNKARLAKRLKRYAGYNVPVYVGEFGIASRCPHCKKEYDWVRDVFRIFKDYGYHWTYWTYKSVGGMTYPDGLFQLFDTTGTIGKGSELSGMDKIALEGPEKVYELLDTKHFVLNRKLMRIIEHYLC